MVAQLVKTIKPKRLDIPAVKKRVEKVLRDEGKEIVIEFRKTVKTWHNKPDFEALIDTKGGDLILIVGPTGNADAVDHWVWTDEGTEPHVIQAKNGGRLFFGTSGGKAKTTPGIIGSNPGVLAGKPYTRPQAVNHPGTKARGFTAKVMSATRRKGIIYRLIQAAKVGAK